MLPTQASDDATKEEATASCAPGLRAEVEARLRWARAGWKWGMAQFWRNTGRKSRKGVSIPASLKISLGRERLAHDTVFFVDMLPLPKLAEVIERLPTVTLPWYRQLYRALVDLHGSNPGDTLFGILRAANDRGAKGAYVPCSLARLNKSEAVTQIIVDGTEVVFPMRSYNAKMANAPDWKGFWNGFDSACAENDG